MPIPKRRDLARFDISKRRKKVGNSLGHGAWGIVEEVTLRKGQHLARKSFYPVRPPTEMKRHLLKTVARLNFLRKRGFPVPRYSIIEMKNNHYRLYFPDLTRNEKYRLIDRIQLVPEQLRTEELGIALVRLAGKLNAIRLRAATDAFFVVIPRNGNSKPKVYIGDVDLLTKQIEKDKQERKFAQDLNAIVSAFPFSTRIKLIQEYFRYAPKNSIIEEELKELFDRETE